MDKKFFTSLVSSLCILLVSEAYSSTIEIDFRGIGQAQGDYKIPVSGKASDGILELRLKCTDKPGCIIYASFSHDNNLYYGYHVHYLENDQQTSQKTIAQQPINVYIKANDFSTSERIDKVVILRSGDQGTTGPIKMSYDSILSANISNPTSKPIVLRYSFVKQSIADANYLLGVTTSTRGVFDRDTQKIIDSTSRYLGCCPNSCMNIAISSLQKALSSYYGYFKTDKYNNKIASKKNV